MSLSITVMEGRLVETPELRHTPNNIPVTTFRIAVGRDYPNSDGEYESDFFDVNAWRKTAEYACNNLEKGALVSVAGRLKNRKWADKHNQNRITTELDAERVYSLERKKKSEPDEENPFDGIDPFDGTAEIIPDDISGDGDLPF